MEEGEVGGDMDDDDEDMIIGTIKIVMDHIGYNDKILKNDNWIYDLGNCYYKIKLIKLYWIIFYIIKIRKHKYWRWLISKNYKIWDLKFPCNS